MPAHQGFAIPEKTLQSGAALPVYGLGTWGLGGEFQADRSGDTEAIRSIRTALDHGVTHIDTAEMYGEGHTEELVGRALRGYDRSSVFLASKALAHHLDRRSLVAAAQASLRRLATDYLDLFMIHHPSDGVPIAETLGGMESLVEAGLVRFIGVSNFTRERLDEARKQTRLPIVANQVHYNLRVREAERSGLLEYCSAHHVLLVAWKPLLPHPERTRLLRQLAEKYDKTPVQIALNWLIAQQNVVVICRSRSTDHLRENLGAVGWRLSDEDIEVLRTGFPDQQDGSDIYHLR